MWTDQIVPSPETQGPYESTESGFSSVNNPCPGPQDIDFLAAESEALRRTIETPPEDGAPCPGGFGSGV